MREWPILSSAWQVQAMMQGAIWGCVVIPGKTWEKVFEAHTEGAKIYLYVRESGYRFDNKTGFCYECQPDDAVDLLYCRKEDTPFDLMTLISKDEVFADSPEMEPPTKCPRWASRFTLAVRDIQCTTFADLTLEQLDSLGLPISTANRLSVGELEARRQQLEIEWDQHHDREGERFEDNPEVFLVSFDVLARNIGPKADDNG